MVMFNLACVPPEIWEEIFRLACTDGGYTGRTLALTSTSFRAYSLRVRFRTLAFTSLLHLPQFLDLLSRHGPARIEHLYLLFNNDPASGSYTGTPCNRVGYAAWRKTLSTRVKAYSTVVSLLRAAAPTLQTLCVVSPCAGGYLLRPPPYTFPVLEELSWMGGHSRVLLDQFLTPEDTDKAGAAAPAVLPVLKRVHCIAENAAYAGRVIAKYTAPASLSLTHLRISGIDRRASDVPNVLERILGVRARGAPERAVRERTGEEESRMPRLRRIIIHSAAPPQDRANEDLDGAWAELSTRIASIMDVCDGGREGVRE
ncbi:uncharacterized protein TRAVEDRAFT_20084 [Trametes versicolor FP-101664 SS1]|uniref:uncharacterized protein n=1 Tax=Trametes versicolor (strain FP-101664) TaxID=717944 RepID=UPI00046230F7|nr:uncharacterized protein TRAVEDRAFT_20084 [Trametes versicolor FP-101664 SS1]EIW59788.1 hypothetical protein TRAVEDRAFT_20084 [Trametes versicolor FP-101664 SS1]